MSQRAAEEPCYCCGGPAMWCHLYTRSYGKSRHAEWNWLPLCARVHDWFDQCDGVKAKRELKRMAKEAQRRLTADEVRPVLEKYGWRCSDETQ